MPVPVANKAIERHQIFSSVMSASNSFFFITGKTKGAQPIHPTVGEQ